MPITRSQKQNIKSNSSVFAKKSKNSNTKSKHASTTMALHNRKKLEIEFIKKAPTPVKTKVTCNHPVPVNSNSKLERTSRSDKAEVKDSRSKGTTINCKNQKSKNNKKKESEKCRELSPSILPPNIKIFSDAWKDQKLFNFSPSKENSSDSSQSIVFDTNDTPSTLNSSMILRPTQIPTKLIKKKTKNDESISIQTEYDPVSQNKIASDDSLPVDNLLPNTSSSSLVPSDSPANQTKFCHKLRSCSKIKSQTPKSTEKTLRYPLRNLTALSPVIFDLSQSYRIANITPNKSATQGPVYSQLSSNVDSSSAQIGIEEYIFIPSPPIKKTKQQISNKKSENVKKINLRKSIDNNNSICSKKETQESSRKQIFKQDRRLLPKIHTKFLSSLKKCQTPKNKSVKSKMPKSNDKILPDSVNSEASNLSECLQFFTFNDTASKFQSDDSSQVKENNFQAKNLPTDCAAKKTKPPILNKTFKKGKKINPKKSTKVNHSMRLKKEISESPNKQTSKKYSNLLPNVPMKFFLSSKKCQIPKIKKSVGSKVSKSNCILFSSSLNSEASNLSQCLQSFTLSDHLPKSHSNDSFLVQENHFKTKGILLEDSHKHSVSNTSDPTITHLFSRKSNSYIRTPLLKNYISSFSSTDSSKYEKKITEINVLFQALHITPPSLSAAFLTYRDLKQSTISVKSEIQIGKNYLLRPQPYNIGRSAMSMKFPSTQLPTDAKFSKEMKSETQSSTITQPEYLNLSIKSFLNRVSKVEQKIPHFIYYDEDNLDGYLNWD